ncbi:MAG TPA: hypothetical protein VHP11_08925 [Tepidisphaeraceae bacterium]|nr:hypothetical protein [Tepidisphaeraceae bacterium]
MNNRRNGKNSSEQPQQRLDEKQMSAVIRGVFWFAWLTAKYRQVAHLAGRAECQNAELN